MKEKSENLEGRQELLLQATSGELQKKNEKGEMGSHLSKKKKRQWWVTRVFSKREEGKKKKKKRKKERKSKRKLKDPMHRGVSSKRKKERNGEKRKRDPSIGFLFRGN